MESSDRTQEAGRNGAAAEASAKPTVCFLGPISSYTHQATLQAFPTDKFNLMPVETIKDIFTTTQSGRASCGVVPFENSTNGVVVFTLDQFADRAGEFPDLSVCAEIYLDVHHCLVGRHSPQEEGQAGREQPLRHIQRVYSHPQAFGQCIRFLSSRLRGVETIDVSSTSRAAELAKADPTGSSAAVSSAVAASLLGLDVLARNVEDREDNTTRFFVLRRGATTTTADAPIPELEEVLDEQRRKRAGPEGAEALVEGEGRGGDVYARTKSLASFTVPHRAPGALADVLESFRRARLNLTSISSRPSLAAPFRYVFFVEFEGHRERDPEGRVRAALEGAAAAAQSCRWLGSWDSMR
ncbi:PDT-domain-containing protein [Hypomontagnella submonticulosa]|nr:PDT-domain-containing protein [Hypomontagnella submonticulosa]